jgi:predicted membrane chloride channel (bestrophin family)
MHKRKSPPFITINAQRSPTLTNILDVEYKFNLAHSCHDTNLGIPWYLTFIFRFSWKTLIVCILAGLSTWLSVKYNLLINLRGTNIVWAGVVLPVVFSINAAYQRREYALHSWAAIKANIFAIRLAYAHWGKDGRVPADLTQVADIVMENLFEHVRMYLMHPSVIQELEENVLLSFARLSLINEKLRAGGVSAPELSRVNEYIRVSLVQFESMKMIKIYRTPGCVRGFTKFFLTVIPIVYGPVFAYITEECGYLWPGVILAIIFSTILNALDTAQDTLEMPFGTDLDDIHFIKPEALLSKRVVDINLLNEQPAHCKGCSYQTHYKSDRRLTKFTECLDDEDENRNEYEDDCKNEESHVDAVDSPKYSPMNH